MLGIFVDGRLLDVIEEGEMDELDQGFIEIADDLELIEFEYVGDGDF